MVSQPMSLHRGKEVVPASWQPPEHAYTLACFQVSERQPLMEAGLDSLGAVELRDALGANYGIDLPATFVFDYPSPGAMAEHLSALLTLGSAQLQHAAQEQQEERVAAWPDQAPAAAARISAAAVAAGVAEAVQDLLGSVAVDQVCAS